jgi:phage terminase large subunit
MHNNSPIYDEICYQKGLQNGTIARILQNHGLSKNHDIFADSAEPKSIDEINTYGFSVQGVDKGADSILFGISILQECPFYVTRRSIHLIKELRQYCWDRDKTGAYLNKPVKINDHAIDAIRYIAMMLQANRKYIDETASNEALLLALKIFN